MTSTIRNLLGVVALGALAPLAGCGDIDWPGVGCDDVTANDTFEVSCNCVRHWTGTDALAVNGETCGDVDTLSGGHIVSGIRAQACLDLSFNLGVTWGVPELP